MVWAQVCCLYCFFVFFFVCVVVVSLLVNAYSLKPDQIWDYVHLVWSKNVPYTGDLNIKGQQMFESSIVMKPYYLNFKGTGVLLSIMFL